MVAGGFSGFDWGGSLAKGGGSRLDGRLAPQW
jgi:hypothetical protein